MRILPNSFRHHILNLIPEDRNDLIGVELGVARGTFSRRMLDTGRFKHFFGVDLYCDFHDVREYKSALRLTGLFSQYKLLRMRFDQALDLFDDNSIDFVYVDGYAHTGQEGGETIYEWFRKVKIGGVIGGDDYHERWPLVIKAVNKFSEDVGEELCVTEMTEEVAYAKFPSWAIVKQEDRVVTAPPDLVKQGKDYGHRVRQRDRRYKLRPPG